MDVGDMFMYRDAGKKPGDEKPDTVIILRLNYDGTYTYIRHLGQKIWIASGFCLMLYGSSSWIKVNDYL